MMRSLRTTFGPASRAAFMATFTETFTARFTAAFKAGFFQADLSQAGRRARWAAVLALAASAAACSWDDENSDGGSTPPPGTPVEFRLGVSVSAGGSVASQPAGIDCGSTCTARYTSGTVVVLTARAAAGQVFSGWGGACTGTASTCSVTMDQARDVTAAFAAAPPSSYTLALTLSGSGQVVSQPAGIDCGTTCSASFPVGASVVLTPTPAAGQTFSAWGGVCAGAGATCTVVMSEARSATASFAPVPAVQWTLDLSVAGSGVVRSAPAGIDCGSSCSAPFADGSTVVLTATPAAGQVFSAWSGACSGTQASCTLAMTQARSAAASFAAAPAPAQWQPAQLLENSDDFNVAGTNTFSSGTWLTAISPSGDALVIWEQSDGQPNGSTRKVFSRRYVAGQGWDPATTVPGLSTASSSVVLVQGQLLMDASGTATWVRPNGEARRYTAAGGWGSAQLPPSIAAGTIGPVVMDGSGNITVLASSADVYANTLPANGSWGSWTRVDASGSLAARRADLALSSNGTAMAVWREANPGDSNYSLKAALYTPGGGWQTPQTIENVFTNVNDDSQPRVAMDAAGNAIAVWHQGNSIYHNVYAPATGWGTATEVDAGQVSSTFSARINLVMTPDGRAVVAWNSGLFAMRSLQYTPGTGFSAPQTVAPYSVDRSLGLSDDGQAVVVYASPTQWPNPVSGTLNVYTRRLVWGGGWSEAALIETRDGGLRGSPEVAFNRAGQGLAVWGQNDVANSDARNSLWGSLLR